MRNLSFYFLFIAFAGNGLSAQENDTLLLNKVIQSFDAANWDTVKITTFLEVQDSSLIWGQEIETDTLVLERGGMRNQPAGWYTLTYKCEKLKVSWLPEKGIATIFRNSKTSSFKKE